ncbi:Poly(U)-specific endoribonuclease homolog [Gryllus bimaculatus]|nr:Poly(U)-specific endoribonuclease homolog [Gryllus bimaculatus]
MQICMRLLLVYICIFIGLVRRNTNALKSLLRELWFTMYSRGGGKMGSSAFEHVFLAELKRGEISGMHNWIFFSFEEARNTADYMGYIRKLELGNKGAIAKIHYKWSNVVKPVGSMFVGTSPELEMALYTICFLTRPDDRCQITLGNKVVTIRTHTFRYRGKNLIGSAFPEI